MALTVVISGTNDIEQGGSTTLTATVTDSNGNAVEGATVAWSASDDQGSFSDESVDTGSNGEAETTYTADFTDTDDVDVTITASATLAANDSPTVSGATLTSLSDLGIENIVANILVSSAGDINPSDSGSQDIWRDASVGTIDAGSDAEVATGLTINRIRWSPAGDQLILNRSGTIDWSTWDDTNQDKSIFVVTSDGSYHEFPVDEVNAIGGGFINWDAPSTATAFIAAMDGIDAGDTLVIGVGDADSVGFPEDTGSDTETVTARAALAAPTNLSVTVGNTELTLSWDAVTGATGYETSLDGTNWTDRGNVTSYTFTGLTNGTEETLYVRATDADGESASASATGTPSTTPSAPTGLSVDAGDGELTLSWTIGDDGGSDLTDTEVSTDGETWNSLGDPAATSHTFTGLDNGTAQTVYVRHVNARGDGASASATGTPNIVTNIIDQSELPEADYDDALIPVAIPDPDDTDEPKPYKLTRTGIRALVRRTFAQIAAGVNTLTGSDRVDYTRLKNAPTLTQGTWTPAITNAPSGFTVTLDGSPTYQRINNSVYFTFKFTIEGDGNPWTVASPRFSLPVTGTPENMAGIATGYGGSERKFIETLFGDTISASVAISGAASLQAAVNHNGTIYAGRTGGIIYTLSESGGTWSASQYGDYGGQSWGALASNGTNLYGWDITGNDFYRINSASNAVQLGSNITPDIIAMAFVGDTLYGSDGSGLRTINISNGAQTDIGNYSPTAHIATLFEVNGKLYGSDTGTPYEIWEIDVDNANVTQVGNASSSAHDGVFIYNGRAHFVTSGLLTYIDIYSPPIMSVDFEGSAYTTAIGHVIENSDLIQVTFEKLQSNDGDVLIQVTGSYRIAA